MYKNLVWAGVTIVAALLQATWPDAFRVQGTYPDLVLLLVVYFAMTDGEERAMLTGALGGLFQDVVTDSVVGHHMLCHVVIGYLTARVAARLITDHPAVKVGLVFAASVAGGVLHTVILSVQDPQLGAMRTVVARVVPGAFYTALITPLALLLVDRAFRRFSAV